MLRPGLYASHTTPPNSLTPILQLCLGPTSHLSNTTLPWFIPGPSHQQLLQIPCKGIPGPASTCPQFWGGLILLSSGLPSQSGSSCHKSGNNALPSERLTVEACPAPCQQVLQHQGPSPVPLSSAIRPGVFHSSLHSACCGLNRSWSVAHSVLRPVVRWVNREESDHCTLCWAPVTHGPAPTQGTVLLHFQDRKLLQRGLKELHERFWASKKKAYPCKLHEVM